MPVPNWFESLLVTWLIILLVLVYCLLNAFFRTSCACLLCILWTHLSCLFWSILLQKITGTLWQKSLWCTAQIRKTEHIQDLNMHWTEKQCIAHALNNPRHEIWSDMPRSFSSIDFTKPEGYPSNQITTGTVSEASPQEVPDAFFPVVSQRKQHLKRAFKNFWVYVFNKTFAHSPEILLGSSRETPLVFPKSFCKYPFNIRSVSAVAYKKKGETFCSNSPHSSGVPRLSKLSQTMPQIIHGSSFKMFRWYSLDSVIYIYDRYIIIAQDIPHQQMKVYRWDPHKNVFKS